MKTPIRKIEPTLNYNKWRKYIYENNGWSFIQNPRYYQKQTKLDSLTDHYRKNIEIYRITQLVT